MSDGAAEPAGWASAGGDVATAGAELGVERLVFQVTVLGDSKRCQARRQTRSFRVRRHDERIALHRLRSAIERKPFSALTAQQELDQLGSQLIDDAPPTIVAIAAQIPDDAQRVV